MVATLFAFPLVARSPVEAAVVFSQSFDGVTAPSLPAGWSSSGTPGWVTTTARSDSAPNAAFAPSHQDTTVRDLMLISPAVSLPAGLSTLTFRHDYDTEENGPGDAFDGGVLEIKIGAGQWRDILAAGGTFVSGGYNARIADVFFLQSPLGGRRVWGGNSGGFVTTVVNLPASAGGQTMQLRWRYGQDSGFTTEGKVQVGWFVDSIRLDQPRADLSVSKSSPPSAVIGSEVTYSISVDNLGPDDATSASLTDSLPAGATFVSVSAPSGWTCPTTPPVGQTGNVVCTRASLPAAGGAQVFHVTVRATAGGAQANSASISSATADLVEGNDTSTATVTILKATPAITTQASAGGAVGGAVTDTATVSGGFNPTGSVTFRLFSDPACTKQVFTSTNPLSTGTATSSPFIPTATGTYYWVARYDGDAANNAVTAHCQAPGESVTVTKASPTLATTASPGNLVGAPVRDTGTLAGGFSPTGSVTFRLYSDPACTSEVFASTATVTGSSATSAWFTPAAPGTYRWTAAYAGDANNNPATSPCGAPDEQVTLDPFQPPAFTRTITGDFLGPMTVGGAESVLIVDARVTGPVTVQPGGALTVLRSKINRGVAADRPSFLSICGTEISGPPPAQALGVSNAGVPIRVGDPANGCAGNRLAGHANLSANLAVTFAANGVSHDATITGGGPGNTVLRANTVFGTLACSGNAPAPVNGGQINTAGAKTGQCAGL